MDARTLDEYFNASMEHPSGSGAAQSRARFVVDPLPPQLVLPELKRWHVASQDRLLAHLRAIWGERRARIMVDLGSHASHGHFSNISDALLMLDSFGHIPGSVVMAVDAFEDFAIDLQRRFDAHNVYSTMPATKLSLFRFLSRVDGRRERFSTSARMHSSCCADVWCNYARIERERQADHLCRITRMRLGILPMEEWLHRYPSSHSLGTLRALANPNVSVPDYRVESVRLETLWRAPPLSGRRIDLLKVDIDATWRSLGGLEELLAQRQLGVMVMEIDGSWGALSAAWNVTALDQLAWVARRNGYNSYLKVPCRALRGPSCCGSLETGTWRWNYKERRYRPGPSTWGEWATSVFPLATVGAPFAPSRYHAKRPHGVQDVMLVDAAEADLVQQLPTRMQADCAPPPSPPSPAGSKGGGAGSGVKSSGGGGGGGRTTAGGTGGTGGTATTAQRGSGGGSRSRPKSR